MEKEIDPNRSDETSSVEDDDQLKEVTGQPANDIPDGTGSNTGADNTGDDAASGGPA